MVAKDVTDTGEDPARTRRSRANRANARHSTGPRSPEGRARSSLNALRHGIHARITEEEIAQMLRERAAGQDQPLGVAADEVEVFLVNLVVLERARRAYAQTMSETLASLNAQRPASMQSLRRIHDAQARALGSLLRLQRVGPRA